ncbi:MAG: hypothetical protein LBB83_08290 [Treponema sp.]|jgi:hypothetical protein|nr:hypothetical protein [Treponema sp.]
MGGYTKEFKAGTVTQAVKISPSGQETFGASIVENGLNFFGMHSLVSPEDTDGIAGPGLWFCFRQNLEQAGFEALMNRLWIH